MRTLHISPSSLLLFRSYETFKRCRYFEIYGHLIWMFSFGRSALFSFFSAKEDMKWPTNDPNRIPFGCLSSLTLPFVCTLSVALSANCHRFWREWIITNEFTFCFNTADWHRHRRRRHMNIIMNMPGANIKYKKIYFENMEL